MNYNELKQNVEEYLRVNFDDSIKTVYDNDKSKSVLKEETEKYLVNTNFLEDTSKTASILFNDLFGLGVIEEIISDETITDISFNGNALWVQSNKFGRRLYDRQITQQEAYIITEKIANQAQKQFNLANPILDVEYETIRLNAIHESLSPDGRSFSIRLLKAKNMIDEESFPATKELLEFLKDAMNSRKNIIISGQTGSGKSELQKYLIKYINDRDKVVLISDNNELKLGKLYPHKDIYTWVTKQVDVSTINVDFKKLIKPALRYNPEWLIISEARGEEAFDMINAATTGHSIITTIHANDATSIPNRLLNMSCEKMVSINENTLKNNIYNVLDIGIHMQTTFTDEGFITRAIDQVVLYDNAGFSIEIYNSKDKVLRLASE